MKFLALASVAITQVFAADECTATDKATFEALKGSEKVTCLTVADKGCNLADLETSDADLDKACKAHKKSRDDCTDGTTDAAECRTTF